MTNSAPTSWEVDYLLPYMDILGTAKFLQDSGPNWLAQLESEIPPLIPPQGWLVSLPFF